MSTRRPQCMGFSAALNTTRQSQGRISRDLGGATVTAATISFSQFSTVTDSANGFGAIAVNDMLQIRGPTLNARTWRVHGVASTGQFAVRPLHILTEAAGATFTVTRK